MKIEIGFGQSTQVLDISDDNIQAVLTPNPIVYDLTGEDEVRRALQTPIGSPRLSQIVHPGETVAIVTSDITRPCPSYRILPSVLDELYAAGIDPKDITLVFALGSHRPHTEEERRHLAGERAFTEISCIDADPTTAVHLGYTSRGTPVDIVEKVAHADRRICIGNIEYHYFAGYSGGAKAIMPGVSTRDAIQSNHKMMIQPEACAGNLDSNPLRSDIEEAANICGVDFIVNVILDENKRIIKAVAGDVTLAHREGCAFLDTLYEKRIDKRADIVVVSQGGSPKDINLYQTQKALDNAKHAVKKGGIIILVGACQEGLGEKTFEYWMTRAKNPNDMIEWVQNEFKLGGHKAAAIAMVLENADIYLVSQMDPEFVRSIFLEPFPDVQSAINAAFDKLGSQASVIVMPYGGSTLPRCTIDT